MSCSAEQLSALLDFLCENKDLARGLLRSADGRLRAKRLWGNLAEHLNSLGSSVKTVQQWQKVWTDRKHLAKKNAAANRRSAAATGGGEGIAPLASWELRVLSIMGEGFGAPETTARVPIIPAINFVDEVASYETNVEERAGPSSAPQLVEQQAGHSSIPQHVEQLAGPLLTPHESVDPALRNPVRAPPRRRRVSGHSVSDRLFRCEEEKLVVLRGIRDNIQLLTKAIENLVDLKKKEFDQAH